jgi:hypothetical protein
MTAEEALKEMRDMCNKCPGATYVPEPGDVPHCGFTCESTIGYEDIIETARNRRAKLKYMFEGADQ